MQYYKIFSSIFLSFLAKEVEKEWRRLRENYRKCLKRQELASRSGAGAKTEKTCQFYDELTFLKEIFSNRERSSNINESILAPISSPPPHIENYHQNQPSPLLSPSCSSFNSLEQSPNTASSPVSFNIQSKQKISKKRKQPNGDLKDALTKALLTEEQTTPRNSVDEKDSDTLFCLSLVESLKKLPSKSNKRVRIKIMEVLLDLEDE